MTSGSLPPMLLFAARLLREPLATLRAGVRAGSLRLPVVVYPNVHCNMERGTAVRGEGRLFLGKRSRGGRYFPSQYVMRGGSELNVRGKFAIHTGCCVCVNQGAILRLGSGYASNGLVLDCFESISIGEGACISKNVTIRDSDDHTSRHRQARPGACPIHVQH